MADGLGFEVPELRQWLAELALLPQFFQQRVMRGAVATAASVMRREAKALAPRDTGLLQRAIFQMRLTQECTPTLEVWKVDVRSGKVTTRSGKQRPDAYYARWVEYGHFARVSESGGVGGARFSKAERQFLATGAGVVSGAYWVPAKPFMRPAFANTQAAALQAMADYIRENLPLVTGAMRYLQTIGA